ncbi:receptor-like kinase TMK3 [Helianthus annuus]|uniref:receptor-like kinase TMK3 n=1 Tax=Helianthus annuus TaxID=4232 RepID=UPI000B8F1E71|nr:receptor-like kinase TMK3 [Helianthus annuus]
MGSQPDNSNQLSPGITPSTGDSVIGGVPAIQLKKKPNVVPSLTPVAVFAGLALLTVALGLYLCKLKKATSSEPPSSLVIHPLDTFNSDNTIGILIANDTHMHASVGSGSSESPVIKSGNMIIWVQVLKNATKNFGKESELGHGGFGIVYKGQLDNGTKIAVLTKVRHRHLVSLLGYSTEGLERILVYEYMPQGALSGHLFHWKNFKLEPLCWKRRLNIALDMARGTKSLHTLAYQSFIHRDLKSSNILLGDDFRAKVSDFGMVKLVPDGWKSIMTRVAGMFGYVAPEYDVIGKLTTKVEVFSRCVVLMELLTDLMVLDKDRPKEKRYLVEWFWLAGSLVL